MLVDDQIWMDQFHSHFEQRELFHSLKFDLRADAIVFDLFLHNPEDLEKLISHRVIVRRISRDSSYYVSTAEGVRELTQDVLKRVANKK